MEFEKPLVRIEREIAELEAVQTNTHRDMSEDIRELRLATTHNDLPVNRARGILERLFREEQDAYTNPQAQSR